MTPLEKAARALCLSAQIHPEDGPTHKPYWRDEAENFSAALRALYPDAPPAVRAWIDDVLREGGEHG